MKKKSILIVTVFMALSFVTFGQKAFQKSDNVISAGIGFLGITWKGATFSANYERGVTDNFGAGVHAGYSQYSTNGYTYTAIIIGLKGAYHFSTTAKMDPYAGAELGYISISHTGQNKYAGAKSYTPVGVGIYGGVRYFLTPGVAVYGELHLSTFSIIGAGVCFKL